MRTLQAVQAEWIEVVRAAEAAEVELRAVAIAAGVDQDAAVERARQAHMADVELSRRSPWSAAGLAAALRAERDRLLAPRAPSSTHQVPGVAAGVAPGHEVRVPWSLRGDRIKYRAWLRCAPRGCR